MLFDLDVEQACAATVLRFDASNVTSDHLFFALAILATAAKPSMVA